MKKGIIYKFTILSGHKFNGRNPYYVGQHWGSLDNYWGSGRIWDDFLKRLRKDYPTCWKKLIKKEILYENFCSQRVLDKLEECFIKKEKSHYSYGLGGCNVLWGTANQFGSGSPMKDPIVRKKCSESAILWNIKNPDKRKERERKRFLKLHNTDYKQRISKTLSGRYVGVLNPNYGNKWNEEQKKKQSDIMKGRYIGVLNPNYGNKWNEEQRRQMSEKKKKQYLNGCINPMTGKVRINNGVLNKVIDKNSPLPDGYVYGMKPRIR
jgi:hypothetical protein